MKPGSILPWVICGLGAIFYCYEYLLRVAPSVMVPELMDTFQISAAALGNLTAFYYYAYTPAQIPVGVMMDRYGPRYILTLAILACAIGTVLFGVTTNFWVAASGRFLLGLGSAFAFVGVLKLATAWLPPNRFAFVSGMATTLGMLGAMTGQMVMTGLVQKIGWQNTIFYSAFLGFVLTPILWLIIRDTPQAHKTNKVEKQQIRWGELFKQVGAVATNHQIWINGIIGFLLFLPTTVFAELWGVQYLRSVYHFTPAMSALAVSMIFGGWAVGGPIAGFISDHLNRRRLPLLVGEVVATALLFVLLLAENLPVPVVLALLFVFGAFSGVEVICFAIGRENAPSHVAGIAVSVTNFLIMMGGVIFQPVVGSLLDCFWSGEMVNGIPIYSRENYQMALMLLPIGLLISIGLTFFLKETYCKPVEN